MARVGESEEDREQGLEGEVDGEEGGLEGGELGPGQGAEGDYAADEGVEDCAAEECAVSGL